MSTSHCAKHQRFSCVAPNNNLWNQRYCKTATFHHETSYPPIFTLSEPAESPNVCRYEHISESVCLMFVDMSILVKFSESVCFFGDPMNSREITSIFWGFHIFFIPLSPCEKSCEKPRCFASTHGDPRGHAGQHHLGSNATGSGTVWVWKSQVEKWMVDDVWLIFFCRWS